MEMLHPEVFVPDEDVVVLVDDVRVQEPLGEPPFRLVDRRDVHGGAAPPQIPPLLHHAVVVEDHYAEAVREELRSAMPMPMSTHQPIRSYDQQCMEENKLMRALYLGSDPIHNLLLLDPSSNGQQASPFALNASRNWIQFCSSRSEEEEEGEEEAYTFCRRRRTC
jgi:hypothetical protein